MAVRERVGTLTVGSAAYPLRLHPRRPMPYRPSYQTVWPTYDYGVAGRSGALSGDPNIRIWHMDGFSDGEGADLFDEDESSYNYSTNCRPKPYGEGLVLGPLQSLTTNKTPATFADAAVFGMAHGKLWAGADTTVHSWDTTLEQWETAGWSAGPGSGTIVSICDMNNAANAYADTLLVGCSNKKIYKVTAGANTIHYDTGGADDFAMAPILISFDGYPYALDTDGLYRIDQAAANTRTQVAVMYGSAAVYNALSQMTRQRIACSDVGLVWYQMEDGGATIIWQYNANTDTAKKVGRLPVDFAIPYSIHWANGFIFVGFRYADRHAGKGDAYLYYQRGSQRGVAGPIRNLSASSASQPVRIAGVIGDNLIVYFDGAVWAYNLSAGAFYQMCLSTTTNVGVKHAACLGKDVFLAYVNNTNNCERMETDKYTTGTARWASGRFDFGFQGLDKILLDVTVVTEPLPANTQITLEVSVEGAAATAVTGTFDTDGQTSYTWTVSTVAASLVGREFELFLIPKTTSTSATPTVRSVSARAVGGERQRTWTLELDPGTWEAGSEGYGPRSSDVLADIRSVGESNALATFTNPWEVEEWDAPASYTVVPVALTGDAAEGDGLVVLELREASYV